MKARATKAVLYSVWKLLEGEGWVPWGGDHDTRASAERDLRQNFLRHRGDEKMWAVVKQTCERLRTAKAEKR